MSNLINPDNRVMQFITKLADTVFLNLLWLIFSLPIVTIGASTTALFTVTERMVRDEEGNLWKGFLQAFQANLKNATRT